MAKKHADIVEQPNPPIPAGWQEIKPIQGTVTAQPPFVPIFPAKNWWAKFNDPYLVQYLQAAINNNHDLKTSVLRIEEARQLANIVRANQLPMLSIAANYQRQHNSDNISGTGLFGSTSTLGLTPSNTASPNLVPRISRPGATYNLITIPLEASYEVDLFGKNHLKTKSAREQIAINTQQARVTELNLIGSTASAYLNLVRADKEVAIAQALIDNLNQANQLRYLQYQTGLTTYDIILRAEQDLASARESLTVYQQQQGIYAHQLSVLMGQDPASQTNIPRTDLDKLTLPTQIEVGIPSQLLQRRPDILAIEDLLTQAHINVKEARREFYPTLNILGEFGLGSTHFSNLFNWQSRIIGFAASAVQSLYTGGAKTATLNVYKVRVQEDMETYVQTVLNSFEDVEDSLSLYKSSANAYQDYVNQVGLANKVTNLAQIRFTTGIGNKIDLLAAQQQALTFSQLSNASKGDCLIDEVSLYKALGGGDSAP